MAVWDEVWGRLMAWWRPPVTVPRHDTRQPDGKVGWVAVKGSVHDRNAHPSEPARFIALEPTAETSIQPRTASRRSPPLMGRVAVLSCFIGRDGKRWSEREIRQAHHTLDRAGVWLEREAARWGVPMNIELADTYFEAEDTVDEDVEIEFVSEGDHDAPFEAQATVKAIASASRAAAQLGFLDLADLIQQVNLRVDSDLRVWLLHFRRAGRSMAVPPEEALMPAVAVAICYAREASLPEPLSRSPAPDSVTIVHELLHLFGATDKYGAPLSAFPAQTVTERDIMRLSYEALSRLRVDPGTAAEIGWRDVGNSRV